MHWSKPRAQQLLWALRRCDGSATTRQLAAMVGSTALHTDASSLRCYLEANGWPREALSCQFQRTTELGRRVYRYHLDPEVVRSGLEDREPEAAIA